MNKPKIFIEPSFSLNKKYAPMGVNKGMVAMRIEAMEADVYLIPYPSKIKYKKILLKLSGEALAGDEVAHQDGELGIARARHQRRARDRTHQRFARGQRLGGVAGPV